MTTAGATVVSASAHRGFTTPMAGAVMAMDGEAVITIHGDTVTVLGDGTAVITATVDMQDIMAVTVTGAMALGVRHMATTTVTTIGIMATTLPMDIEAMPIIQRVGATTETPIP